MIKALEAGNNQDTKMFFASVVPHLKSFDEDDMIFDHIMNMIWTPDGSFATYFEH